MWGLFFNEYGKRTDLDLAKLELGIQYFMGDEDVSKKSGIYEYLLTGEEKKLSIRAFDRRDALAAYEKQGYKSLSEAKHLSLSRCTPYHTLV